MGRTNNLRVSFTKPRGFVKKIGDCDDGVATIYTRDLICAMEKIIIVMAKQTKDLNVVLNGKGIKIVMEDGAKVP